MIKTPTLIVAIGASAGGIPAVTEILKNLPDDTGMTFIVILHLDPNFKSNLAQILDRKSVMPVRAIEKPLRLEADSVYVISPDTKISIVDGIVEPSPREPADGPPKPIDHLFHTLANVHGSEAIGLVLTGLGMDGASGVKSIKELDGLTIAQDPSDAAYPSMPVAAIETGCIDLILSLEEIPGELVRLANSPFTDASLEAVEDLSEEDKTIIEDILETIYSSKGVSFVNYKQSTIHRRIQRRMAINRMRSIRQYADYVKEDSSEQHSLFEDLLIKVTRFFRDPAVFKNLQSSILPHLWPKTKKRDTLRIWVPACASGEEVYSLAIVILEYFEFPSKTKFQFFGTDLSEGAIHHARKGWYPKAIEAQVSQDRLSQFFVKAGNGYQISQLLRDMCIFSTHDVTRDPPFSHIDFLSCRNLLIYFDQELQKKVIPLFHYSLNPQGALMLGPAETMYQQGELFEPIDKLSKVYRKSLSFTPKLSQFFPTNINVKHLEGTPLDPTENEARPPALIDQTELMRKTDDIVLRYLSPPGFLINAALDIIQYRGDTSFLVAPSHGPSSLNILKLVRSDLAHLLKDMLFDFDRKGPIKSETLVHIKYAGEVHSVRIRITPIFTRNTSDSYSIVTFHKEYITSSSNVDASSEQNNQTHLTVLELERQLFEAKELLRDADEKQQATFEELKAANEEILSSNEELQSTNEELEASKEELQSINEELTTVNEELHKRNDMLNNANDDLRNLLEFSQVATIMLGRDLKIRRFTPEAEKLFRLLKNDVGRPLSHLNPIFNLPDLEERVVRVINSMQADEVELEIPSLGNRYVLEIRPYKTGDFQIAGALIGLNEVSLQRQSAIRKEEDLQSVNSFLREILNTLEKSILVMTLDHTITLVNQPFCTMFQVEDHDLIGRKIDNLKQPFLVSSELKTGLERLTGAKEESANFQIATFIADEDKSVLISSHSLAGSQSDPGQIMLTFQWSDFDSTERAEL